MSAHRIALGQVFVGALAKLDGLTCQHCLEAGLPGEMLCFLETDADFEIGLLPNRRRHGENKRFNSAVGTLTRTDEKQLDRCHMSKTRAT